jgi:hypothetical protein
MTFIFDENQKIESSLQRSVGSKNERIHRFVAIAIRVIMMILLCTVRGAETRCNVNKT